MPIPVYMPQLSPTMTEGRLAKWLKQSGDTVSAGDVIAEVETDKATMEVEATDDGIIHSILGEAGEDIAVGVPIAVLKEDGEEIPDDYEPVSQVKVSEESDGNLDGGSGMLGGGEAAVAAGTGGGAAAVGAVQMSNPLPKPEINKPAPAKTFKMAAHGGDNAGHVAASPLARRIAADKGIALTSLQGSGPHGRVVAADVENASAAPGMNGLMGGAMEITRRKDTVEKLSPMRKSIASRLTASKQFVPHFYVSRNAKMDGLLDLRKQLNTHYNGQIKLSVNDFIIKACALALADYPAANAAWNDDSIVLFGNVDVSVAVSIDGGLITPIVFNANQKPISVISNEMKALIKDAKGGKLKPEQYEGGGFSLSNMGMYGVDNFQAIVNPPQAAILAVGGTSEQVVVVDGEPTVAQVMTVSLSVDHRVIDGALAAELLGRIVHYLELPAALVV